MTKFENILVFTYFARLSKPETRILNAGNIRLKGKKHENINSCALRLL